MLYNCIGLASIATWWVRNDPSTHVWRQAGYDYDNLKNMNSIRWLYWISNGKKEVPIANTVFTSLCAKGKCRFYNI